MGKHFDLIENLKKLLKHLNFSGIEVMYNLENLDSYSHEFENEGEKNKPLVVAHKSKVLYHFEIFGDNSTDFLKINDSIQQQRDRYDGKSDSCYVIVTFYGNQGYIRDLYQEHGLMNLEIWEL